MVFQTLNWTELEFHSEFSICANNIDSLLVVIVMFNYGGYLLFAYACMCLRLMLRACALGSA